MSQPTVQPADQAVTSVRPTTRRWQILAWLCSLAAITYIGRIGTIQVREDIESSLHLTPDITAWALFSAFNLAYAIFEIPSGRLGDKLGPRKVLTRIVLCWMAFTALTGAAWNRGSLAFFRFLFGAGEAGAFPNIARASREWFPFRERGLAQGLIWMSARWGGAIAPLLMMTLALPFGKPGGWRGAFVLMGMLGVIWVWAFYKNFRDTPHEDAKANEAERALIAGGARDTSKPAPLSWSTMLASPTLWSLSLMYFCSNAGWSFFGSWITPYLKKDLHLSGLSLVLASGGPLFFGGISCLLGGFLTDRQVRLWGRRWGRTLLGVVSYGVAGALLLLTILATAKHVALAYVALCLSSFIKDFGLASSWATTIDVGHRYSGTVAGVMNSLGNLGQVVSPPIVAWMAVWAGTAGHPSWKATLYYYAAMFFIASLAWLFVNPRKVIVYSEADQQRLRAEGQLGV
ncbi:MAG TPA: MFS transporter [Terriglobales bacterium]|nr:MFS transporter [Terriglobales bacterium]